MIIENPDVFKTWLTSILEPLCDADPAALAKYVYALVKKEKPISELREVMVDQLDVFLQQETKPFVEMLFKSLESNEYLKPLEADAKPPTPPPEPEPEKELENEVHATNGTGETRVLVAPPPPRIAVASPAPAPAPAPRHRVVVSRAPPPKRAAPQEQTLVKVLPLSELLEEPVDQLPRRRDRRNDPLRDKEDRRRRRSRSNERRVRARRDPRHTDHERRRIASRSPSPRRYRNRSPPVDRPPSRSRSRSPVALRDRELERDRLRPPRELERDRMSRDREHRERLSRSRERERSRDRSRDRSRGSTSPRDNRLDMMEAVRRRCRDYDEKGYCMRGDLCQWDHGTDPVVLEDAALSSVLTMPHPVPEYNPLAPDIWMAGPGFPFPPPPHPPHPPRELIPIPRYNRPMHRVRHERPMAGAPLAPLPPRHPPPKKNFEFRPGMRPPMPAGGINCSLEVKKVPRGLNDITHLNNHFCKFGKIVNIQVCYEGDPEAALITFSNPTEANVAYKSTEAVLNNRFIKVFWHNPDSKQENMAPSNQQPPAERKNSQHPMSHNKVLINKDNIKATADHKAQSEKEHKEQVANGLVEPKKEVAPAKSNPLLDKSKQVMEQYKRSQEVLQTQLHHQRLLIQKLETGNVSESQKASLMEAIAGAQDGIEKLRKEIIAYGGIIKQIQANAKRPKTREEAQKEILDAELDMFTKQQEGQDVTELMKKITELRRQMAQQFPVHSNLRRPISARGGRFNTSTRFNRVANHAPKAFSVNQSVDHRPKALLISGFETDELQALYTHFSQFGEVSNKEVDLAVPQLVLQYKARSHAEQAMLHGRNYNDRTLSITWAVSSKPAASIPPPSEPKPLSTTNGDYDELREEPQTSEATLLRSDEEDEDETREARSWRR